MELMVMNSDLVALSVIDAFESLIWTERYNEYGDFELYTKVSDEILDILQLDYYLYLEESEYVMIIENVEIIFDIEDGHRLKVTGRSVESILTRRIVWNQTVLSGNLQDGIELLLNENFISPSDPDRTIPNITFNESVDTQVTSLTVDAQFLREEVYEAIKTLCQTNDIGFKVTLQDDDMLTFSLYSGVDRSYNQSTNPFVVFSQQFDNLLDSRYKELKSNYKNVSLVSGEGELSSQITTVVGTTTGLSRRETHTDGSGISQTVDGTPISNADYQTQLQQKGLEDLLEKDILEVFDGSIDVNGTFKMGVDFFLGDIVQLASSYSIEASARITEIIRSQNLEDGIQVYPTFEIIE